MNEFDADRTRQLCCLMNAATERLKCYFCGVGFCEDCVDRMKFGFGGRVSHLDCAKKYAKPVSITEFKKTVEDIKRKEREQYLSAMIRKSRKK
jgi:hypothetical protein